ncbi:MAG: PadR family transcriptional regulator [Planctomycetota bacterium]
MRRNKTRYALLGCLSLTPMTGYDVRQLCEGVLAFFWRESFGQIYTNLRKLEAEGLLKSAPIPGDGGPERIRYRLRPAGLKELRAWLEEEATEQVPRDEMMLKLFFGPEIGPDACLGHIRRYRGQQERRLRDLEEGIRQVEAAQPDSPYAAYWRLGGRRGIRQANASLDWCDEAEEALAGLADVELGDDAERSARWARFEAAQKGEA